MSTFVTAPYPYHYASHHDQAVIERVGEMEKEGGEREREGGDKHRQTDGWTDIHRGG